MKKYILILMSIMALALAACGGGDSSSDDSASGDRFTGTQTITVLGDSDQQPFVMTISGNTVTVIDEDFTASGELSGNDFTVAVPNFTLTEDGITCVFNISYAGSLVSETRTTGNISGSAVCNGINVPITGSFAADS